MLKLGVCSLGNVVACRIVELGKEILPGSGQIFSHDGGLEIYYSAAPAISPSRLFVSGWIRHDGWFGHAFVTADKAKEYVERLAATVKAYNASLVKSDETQKRTVEIREIS